MNQHMRTVWTLVQHSGVRHDPGFAQAVEEVPITTVAARDRVIRAGGVIYDTYASATRAEYAENYPPEVQGLYPRARGTFSKSVINGRPIYVPRQERHVDLAV
jgi:hypothetical protein